MDVMRWRWSPSDSLRQPVGCSSVITYNSLRFGVANDSPARLKLSF
jgi:hypothetical protein